MKKKMITSIPIVDEQKRLVDICFWASRESDNMERESLVGVPAIINKNGVKDILQLKLNEEDQAKFNHSCEIMKENIKNEIEPILAK